MAFFMPSAASYVLMAILYLVLPAAVGLLIVWLLGRYGEVSLPYVAAIIIAAYMALFWPVVGTNYFRHEGVVSALMAAGYYLLVSMPVWGTTLLIYWIVTRKRNISGRAE